MLKANKSDKRRAPTGGHNIMVHVSPRRQLVLPFCRRLPFVSVVRFCRSWSLFAMRMLSLSLRLLPDEGQT